MNWLTEDSVSETVNVTNRGDCVLDLTYRTECTWYCAEGWDTRNTCGEHLGEESTWWSRGETLGDALQHDQVLLPTEKADIVANIFIKCILFNRAVQLSAFEFAKE